ncbi:unnamed protein product, partial [Symbiodinium sp. KB8]
TVTDYIDIWIESVNSPPSIAGPHMVVAYLDDPAGPLEIAGITVADPDVNDTSILDANGRYNYGRITLSLTVNYGKISLKSLRGLTVTGGSGLNDRYVQIEGTLADVNNAIDGLQYQCNTQQACDSGLDTLTLHADDNGFTGAGGPKFFTKVIEVDVQVKFTADELYG